MGTGRFTGPAVTLEQPATALEAVAGLERARLVVEAGMDDAAVVTGLMLRQALFRF